MSEIGIDESAGAVVFDFHPLIPMIHNKRSEGWSLLNDVVMGGGQVKIVLVRFVSDEEVSRGGCFLALEQFLSRLDTWRPFAGQRHLEQLWIAEDGSPHKIFPMRWREYCLRVFFPGTVWQDTEGLRRVLALDFYDDGYARHTYFRQFEYGDGDDVLHELDRVAVTVSV